MTSSGMRNWLALPVSCLLLASSTMAVAQDRPAGRANAGGVRRPVLTILNTFVRQGLRTPFVAEQTTQTFGENGFVSRQIVKRAGPGRERVEFVEPRDLQGEVVLIMGQRVIRTNPRSLPRVVAAHVPVVDMLQPSARFVAAIRSGEVTASLVGTQEVAGRQAWIVEIRPAGTGAFRRLWIDKLTGVRLKQESLDAEGRVLAISQFTKIRYDPVFGPDDFAPRKPNNDIPSPAVQARAVRTLAQAAQAAGFEVRAPTPPPGFELRGIWVVPAARRSTVLLQYSNGIDTIVLSQRPIQTRRPGLLLRQPDTEPRFRGNAMVWMSDGRGYMLSGTAPRATLRAMAERLR